MSRSEALHDAGAARHSVHHLEQGSHSSRFPPAQVTARTFELGLRSLPGRRTSGNPSAARVPKTGTRPAASIPAISLLLSAQKHR